MITINKRTTIQNTLIYNAVQAMNNHPTADEVYAEVRKLCPNISKGTVYRNLNKLADEGKALRVAVANSSDRYDRTTGPHCHFRCLTCDKVYDFEMAEQFRIDETLNLDFKIKDYEFIINGWCKNCKGE